MKKILIISAFLFLCSSTVFCEYFYLKSGEEIKGRIISETTSTVKISLAGSGEKRVLKIKDIFEISVKKKAVAPKPVETYGVEYAKTAFTSENQTAVGDSKEYVTDNRSGVLIYSLKETEPQGKTAASNDNEFDAAAYLLGESSSKSKSSQTQTNNASKPSKPQIPVSNDEDFDAAAYFLGQQANQDSAKSKAISNENEYETLKYRIKDYSAYDGYL